MKRLTSFVLAAALVGGGVASAVPNPLFAQATPDHSVEPSPPPAATTPPGGGPVIDLPPDEQQPPPKPATATPLPAPAVPRGVDPTVVSNQAYATDLGAGRRIPIGAYGEAM